MCRILKRVDLFVYEDKKKFFFVGVILLLRNIDGEFYWCEVSGTIYDYEITFLERVCCVTLNTFLNSEIQIKFEEGDLDGNIPLVFLW